MNASIGSEGMNCRESLPNLSFYALDSFNSVYTIFYILIIIYFALSKKTDTKSTPSTSANNADNFAASREKALKGN